MKFIMLVNLLLFAAALFARDSVPGGTILPVRLNSSLNSKKSKTGQVVSARIMQDVPLAGQSNIPAGAEVIGRVLEVSPATAAGEAKISLSFDTLIVHKRHTPVTTDLRAMASMMEVYEAQLPEMGADRETPENAWVTVFPVGVLSNVRSSPGSKCRGEIDENHEPQALWVFASNACGAYGFEGVSVAHAGRTDPVGQIVLTAEKGDIVIRSGSGLLLRVIRGNY